MSVALLLLLGIAQLAPGSASAHVMVEKVDLPQEDQPDPTSTCPDGEEASPGCGGNGASGGGGLGGGVDTSPSEEGCCFTGFPSGGGAPVIGGGNSAGGGGTQTGSGDGSVPADPADPVDGGASSGSSGKDPLIVLPQAEYSAFDPTTEDELRRAVATDNYEKDKADWIDACVSALAGSALDCIVAWYQKLRADESTFVGTWCSSWGFTVQECQYFWDEVTWPGL